MGEWISKVPPTPPPHECYPPRLIPEDAGPGSQWRCSCGTRWEVAMSYTMGEPTGTFWRHAQMMFCAWYGKENFWPVFQMTRHTIIYFDGVKGKQHIESKPFCSKEHREAWVGP